LAKTTAANKPKIELVQSNPPFDIDFCGPVKDKVKICGPTIVVTPCQPVKEWKCLPEIKAHCLPYDMMNWTICTPVMQQAYCIPSIKLCDPVMQQAYCYPTTCIPAQICVPNTICGPIYGLPSGEPIVCGPSVQTAINPLEKVINQLDTRIQELTREVQALQKKA
jgi:hypothetical protein